VDDKREGDQGIYDLLLHHKSVRLLLNVVPLLRLPPLLLHLLLLLLHPLCQCQHVHLSCHLDK
jgi:hypothetical protein